MLGFEDLPLGVVKLRPKSGRGCGRGAIEPHNVVDEAAAPGHYGAVISFEAPELCQMADEDHLLSLGSIIYPGLVRRHPRENGLRLWVDGGPDDESRVRAATRFKILLGVLRARWPGEGELREERLAGLGPGAARGADGGQWLKIGPVLYYTATDDEVRAYAQTAAVAISDSQNVRNALWLNGRANRTAADFYMIHEYARRDFGAERNITATLGVSRRQQRLLRWSANNLSPLEGGRHACEGAPAPWSLDTQERFIADLLRLWMSHLALASDADVPGGGERESGSSREVGPPASSASSVARQIRTCADGSGARPAFLVADTRASVGVRSLAVFPRCSRGALVAGFEGTQFGQARYCPPVDRVAPMRPLRRPVGRLGHASTTASALACRSGELTSRGRGDPRL